MCYAKSLSFSILIYFSTGENLICVASLKTNSSVYYQLSYLIFVAHGTCLEPCSLTYDRNGFYNLNDILKVKKTVRTLETELVEKITPGAASNPDNVKRVEFILSEVRILFI